MQSGNQISIRNVADHRWTTLIRWQRSARRRTVCEQGTIRWKVSPYRFKPWPKDWMIVIFWACTRRLAGVLQQFARRMPELTYPPQQLFAVRLENFGTPVSLSKEKSKKKWETIVKERTMNSRRKRKTKNGKGTKKGPNREKVVCQKYTGCAIIGGRCEEDKTDGCDSHKTKTQKNGCKKKEGKKRGEGNRVEKSKKWEWERGKIVQGCFKHMQETSVNHQ